MIRCLPSQIYHLSSQILAHPSGRRCLSSNVVDALRQRGLVQALTSENFEQAAEKPISVYLGVDPTARSLHAGNLLALMGLLHFQNHGHQVIALIGGATGSIGDPSGRSSERTFLDDQILDSNVASITSQIHRFFERGQAYARSRERSTAAQDVLEPTVANNMDWTQGVSLLDFLRTVGKGAKLQSMLAKDSVQSRLQSSSSISFTEFTYQLLQAHDFLHLHLRHDCVAQLGGSDQWGNITAGTELVARHYAGLNEGKDEKDRIPRKEVYGLTIPLLTTASGAKFGKSAGNAVWLEEDMTSVLDFYQFFLRTTDADVERYLMLFTLLPIERIRSIMDAHHLKPDARAAQRLLADEVTELVHGQSGLERAQTSTALLYSTDLSTLTTAQVVAALSSSSPHLVRLPRSALPLPLPQLLADRNLSPSKTRARQLLTDGAVHLNGVKLVDAKAELKETDLIDAGFAVLRAGKNQSLVVVVDGP